MSQNYTDPKKTGTIRRYQMEQYTLYFKFNFDIKNILELNWILVNPTLGFACLNIGLRGWPINKNT